MLKDKIADLAATFQAEAVANRRYLHQHPELSFAEAETAKFVASKLKSYGIPCQTDVAGHGVVGIIEGERPGKNVVALRGDMDALPIDEANDVPYKSKHPGVMHACGHDVHTTSLLGAARILQNVKSEIAGQIKLFFQPAEEMFPGGASLMIKEGVLEHPTPSAIFGQHVHPPLEVGKIGMRPGMYMASADEMYMTVTGKGGHGAMPHNGIDPILITAHILTALQQVVSRHSDPTIPSVVTFGKINSTGGNTNVIPNEVKLMGTFRTMDETWRKTAHQKMKKMAQGIAESMGGHCELDIKVGYPCLINEPDLTDRTRRYAETYLGSENVVDLPIRMTAEDFAYFAQAMPGCFYRLGTGNPSKGIISPIHTNTFDVDEDCLRIGTGLMAWLAVCELGNGVG